MQEVWLVDCIKDEVLKIFLDALIVTLGQWQWSDGKIKL